MTIELGFDRHRVTPARRIVLTPRRDRVTLGRRTVGEPRRHVPAKEQLMPVVEESVVIARPPEEAFDFIIKPENIPVWDSSVLKAEQEGSGPYGMGTHTRGTSKIMGRHFDWTSEVVEFDPPRRCVNRSVGGSLEFTITEECEPVEGGTRFTYRIDAGAGLGGVFGRLADPFVERAQARTVRANLETLAELLAEHPDA
jgi:carbon monoxide dehydrogenase subunit G